MRISNQTKTARTLTLTLLLGALLLGAVAEARGHKPSTRQSSVGVVNINTASAEQLQLLPGVGPSKARAIVRYRARAKFKATYALIRVRGIGRKTYRKLRRYLTVKGPTTLDKRPRPEREEGKSK